MRIRARIRCVRLLRGGNDREVATIVSGTYPTVLSQFTITICYHKNDHKDYHNFDRNSQDNDHNDHNAQNSTVACAGAIEKWKLSYFASAGTMEEWQLSYFASGGTIQEWTLSVFCER